MKYEIDRFKNSEVIRCFFKSEKSILIVFLDNHTVEIPYTKENEEKILNEMIIQAMARDAIEFNRLPLKIKYDFSRLITNTFISVCMTYNLNTYPQYYIYRSDIYKIIYSFVLATAGANIARFIYNLVCDLKLSKDVLKYHEFFEMKDEIDKYGDVLLNENISLKEILNINTLDFYSISRVKEILETVKENYNKEKTLIKK